MKKELLFLSVLTGLLLPTQSLYAQGECAGCLPSGIPFSPPPDSLRVGVILVQFSDWATNPDARGGSCQIDFPNGINHYTYQMYYDHIFSTNYRTAPPYGKRTHDQEDLFGSMKEFYKEMSYNKFTFKSTSGIINPPDPANPNLPKWVTLTQTKSYWQSQPKNPNGLLAAALAASGYSTSGYDKVILIYAGNEVGDGLNPTATLSGFVYQVGEKTGLAPRGRSTTLGTFYGIGTHCHEFGHLLGLIDQKDQPQRPSGLSNFELMAVGNQGFMDGSPFNASLGGFHAPTPFSGYSKLKLGWATYEEINSDGPIIFPSLDETDRICVRFINDANHADWDEGEYFFFDNRRPLFTNGNRTFDGDMMNGLLVWHHANSNFSHNGLRFDVEEANGLDQVGDGIGSARNDHLFPGTAGNYTAFTPYTNPNSNKKDGTRSAFALTCVKVNGSGSSAYVTANAYLNFYTGTWSGNVTTNTAWGATVTVTTNVTVNSGVTLTIDPGSVIQFQSGTSLTVNGRLVADSNDPTRRITFTGATATPGFWNGMRINSGSSSNVSTLRRCDIQYATDGITITYTGNSNNVTVDKCNIRSNSYGVYINGNGYSGATLHPTISNNFITDNDATGIDLENYAKPTITGNRIENNYMGYGISANSNSSATITYNFISGHTLVSGIDLGYSSLAQLHRNTIRNNALDGVSMFFNSNVTAYGADTSKGRNDIRFNNDNGIYAYQSSPIFGKDVSNEWGNNWISDNAGYQAYQNYAGYLVRAERCYWSGQQSDVFGNVDVSPYLTSAPSPVGWGKSDAYDPTYLKPSKSGTTTELPTAETNHNLMTSVVAARTNASPLNWSEDLKAAIDEGLTTGDWSRASELITGLHRELQDARLPNVDFTLVADYANNPKVISFVRKMLALVLMEKELVENRIATALAKLVAFGQNNVEHKAELLANAGLIHLYRQNDLAAAQTVLAQLQTMAQNGDASAVEHVKVFGRIIENYHRHRSESSTELGKPIATPPQTPTPPTTPALAQNYPNPFNPTTVIRFHLDERQKVRLVIYDLAGHRVRTLVEGELPAGEQAISWDGRDQQGRSTASGVYFYELVTGNKIERRKMTLLR
jgi:M6 family metalloprotease-like protein